jgi:hypothetical protein
MTLFLQLLITVAAFLAVAWAIRRDLQRPAGVALDSPDAPPLPDPPRKPWPAFGLLAASSGFFLMCTEIFLLGGPELHPLTGGSSILAIVAGGVLYLYGLLDKYILNRGRPTLPGRTSRRLMELFVAGLILLPLVLLLFGALRANPPAGPDEAPPGQSAAPPATTAAIARLEGR